MEKKTVYIIAILLLQCFIKTSLAFEYTDCFPPEGYYDFQNSVDFHDFHVDKTSYQPRDRVIISYDLTNRMNIPIVQGRVRIQIFYNDSNRGEQMIDEFFIPKEYNLMKMDSIPQEYFWYVPDGARSGKYFVKSYLIVGDSFNLAGLSFLPYGPPGVPGKITSFEVVNSGQESSVFFDRSRTLINNQEYKFLGSPPIFTSDDSITIETQLINVGPSKDVNVSMRTYVWDDTDEKNLIDHLTKTETFHIEESETKKIIYTIGNLETNTYEVVFNAESGEERSILKLRLSVEGEKPRFIYFGLDKFPLTEEETTVFVCFSNSVDYISFPSGKIKFEIKDKSGNLLWSDEADVEIPPNPTGGKFEFIPQDPRRYIVLKGTILDNDNNIVDEQTLIYDYSKFMNIKRNFEIKTDKSSYKSGEIMTYTVIYTDEFNDPLDGDVVIYLLNPEDEVVYAHTHLIHGSFSNQIELTGEGIYKLRAIEKERDLKVEKTVEIFSISGGAAIPRIPSYLPMLTVLVVTLLLLFVIYRRHKRL